MSQPTNLTQRCQFFELPSELQEMIFAFAYPRVSEDVRIVTKEHWESEQKDERRRDRANFVAVPFPEPKVSSFLVSKAFFIGAAKAYISAQAWGVVSLTFIHPKVNGLFCQYAQHLAKADAPHEEFLHACRSLTSLRIKFSSDAFNSVTEKLAWEVELTAEDFAGLRLTKKLSKLSGLKKLEMYIGWCIYAEAPAKRQIMEKNAKKYEEYIWPIVSRPKERLYNSTSYTDYPSLYPGSKVRFGTSELCRAPDPGDLREGLIEGKDPFQYAYDDDPSGLRSKQGDLTDDEIPEDGHALRKLILKREADVVAWIRAKKGLH